MYVYLIKNKTTGKIESVNLTLQSAGLVLYGSGNASFADGSVFDLAAIEARMASQPTLEVNYDDGTILVLEHHAVAG